MSARPLAAADRLSECSSTNASAVCTRCRHCCVRTGWAAAWGTKTSRTAKEADEKPHAQTPNQRTTPTQQLHESCNQASEKHQFNRKINAAVRCANCDAFEPGNAEKEAPKAAAFEWLKKVSLLECVQREEQCLGLSCENSAATMIFWIWFDRDWLAHANLLYSFRISTSMMRLSISFIHMRHSLSVSQRIHHDSNLSLHTHINKEKADTEE